MIAKIILYTAICASAFVCRAAVVSVPTWLPEDRRFAVEGNSDEIVQVEQTLAVMRDSLHPKLRTMMKGDDLAAILQWIVHVSQPDVADEAAYFESYKKPLSASAFDRKLLTYRASRLSGVPTRANLRLNVVVRPEPGIDYPGVSPEDEGSTPTCVRMALRAPKYYRRVTIDVGVSPKTKFECEVKCILLKGRAVVSPKEFIVKSGVTAALQVGISQKIAKNNGETIVAIFARAKSGLWGPPSYVRISGDELCEHHYNNDGSISHIDYGSYCDWYKLGENNRILGFCRIPIGSVRGEQYSNFGEKIVEMYPGDVPKVTRKVAYSVEMGKLKYKVLDDDISHVNGSMSFRLSDW